MAFTLSSRAIAPQARLSALPTRRVASVPAAPPLLRSRPAAPASVALPARGGFRAALAGVALQIASPLRRLAQSLRGLTVECNKKKGKGCTLEGTRRKRARVSGFRTRISTPGGLKVLAARRKKGRKVLVPASRPVRWNKQKV